MMNLAMFLVSNSTCAGLKGTLMLLTVSAQSRVTKILLCLVSVNT